MSVWFSRHLVHNAHVNSDRELRAANDEADETNEEINQYWAINNI